MSFIFQLNAPLCDLKVLKFEISSVKLPFTLFSWQVYNASLSSEQLQLNRSHEYTTAFLEIFRAFKNPPRMLVMEINN